MAYSTITDPEVTADNPAKASVWVKFRDNLIACFAADDSGDTALRLEPGAFRNPVNSDAVTVAAVSEVIFAPAGSSEVIRLDAVVIVPGVYRLIGTFAGTGRIKIKKNGTEELNTTSTGAFDQAVTCVNGDHLTLHIDPSGASTASIADFRIKADFAAPINITYNKYY